KPAMEVRPCRRLLAHPSHGFDDLNVGGLDRFMEDRFVMRDPISETSKRIESGVNIFTPPPAASAEGFVEAFAPNGRVVLGTEKANPEGEFQFSDYFSGGCISAVTPQILQGIVNHPLGIVVQGNFWVPKPFLPVNVSEFCV